MAGLDVAADRREIDVAFEQACERRIVEQRNAVAQPPAGYRAEQPVRAVAERTPYIGAVDLVDMEVFPNRHQPSHAAAKIVGVGGEHPRHVLVNRSRHRWCHWESCPPLQKFFG